MTGFAKFLFLRMALFIGLHTCTIGFVCAHTSVPLRLINGSILVAPVLINGQGPFDFVVDTGTNTALIDPAFAETLALQPIGKKPLATLTGSTVVSRYLLNSLIVGDSQIDSVEALGQPLVALRKIDPRIQGIIGFELLQRFSFCIDYVRRRLDLYSREETPASPAGLRVPLSIIADRILVSASANEAPRGTWNLALDSGVSRILVFDDRFQPPPSALSGTPQQNRTRGAPQFNSFAPKTFVTTNTSPRLSSIAKLDSLAIGTLQLRNQPVVILHSEMSSSNAQEDGLLPTALFRAVLFDRTTSTLVFDPY
jgi:predicted aspartyl protease